jgi:hypothetical protein
MTSCKDFGRARPARAGALLVVAIRQRADPWVVVERGERPFHRELGVQFSGF